MKYLSLTKDYWFMPAAAGQLHRLPSHTHFAVCYSTSPISMGRLPSSVYHYNQYTYHCRIFYQKIRYIEQILLLVLLFGVSKDQSHRKSTMELHVHRTLPGFMTQMLYSCSNMRRIYQ